MVETCCKRSGGLATMNKAEMEQAWITYHAHMRQAREDLQAMSFDRAVARAAQCFPSIDGMARYTSKYEGKTLISIDAVRMIVDVAPFLFDSAALKSVSDFAQANRRLVKKCFAELPQRLDAATHSLEKLRMLWNLLERFGRVRQVDVATYLGPEQEFWDQAIETWESMRVVVRLAAGQTYAVSFATRMAEPIWAKCPACGGRAQKAKADFLEPVECLNCRSRVIFVLGQAE